MAFISLAPRLASHCRVPRRMCGNQVSMDVSRRTCLRKAGEAVVAITLSSIARAEAAMYSADTKSDSFAPTGDPNKVETYMPQIEAGYKALVDLERNWELKTRDYDGDVVRRVLGTVGVKSPLFNIRKPFLKSWQIIANSSDDYDLIDRMETEWNDVINGIAAVDYQLYSVSFTELTENKDTLISQGKKSLDSTIVIYKNLLEDLRSVI